MSAVDIVKPRRSLFLIGVYTRNVGFVVCFGEREKHGFIVEFVDLSHSLQTDTAVIKILRPHLDTHSAMSNS